jgi:hypothetical protein
LSHTSDFEEIAPDRYMVRNVRAYPILKGEGILRGQLFELTTWRRDGLLGRLRMAGLSVRTLDDDIEELPHLPPTATGGQAGWRALTSPNERFSRFDATLLRWQPIEPSEQDGLAGVVLIPGEALRRRKGRGAADFYVAAAERGSGIRLLPANETTALLVGYARATASARFVLAAEIDQDALILPEIDLPPAHHEILKRLIQPGTQDRRVVGRGRELAERVFAKLGIQFMI